MIDICNDRYTVFSMPETNPVKVALYDKKTDTVVKIASCRLNFNTDNPEKVEKELDRISELFKNRINELENLNG